MLLPLRHHRDCVDAGIREHLAVIRENLAHVEFPCHRRQPLGAPRGKCFEAQLGDTGDRFTVDFTEPAQSNHTNFQFFHDVASLMFHFMPLESPLPLYAAHAPPAHLFGWWSRAAIGCTVGEEQ